MHSSNTTTHTLYTAAITLPSSYISQTSLLDACLNRGEGGVDDIKDDGGTLTVDLLYFGLRCFL